MKRCAVVLAGGEGTRFWPLSRRDNPKQLLSLGREKTMLAATVARLKQTVEKQDIFVFTKRDILEKVRLALKAEDIPAQNVISEPSAQGTAACIAHAALFLQRKFGECVMLIAPSDAYVREEKLFACVSELAIVTAENTNNLVTVGIKPTFPATGYGYMRFKNVVGGVKPVLRFEEKPNLATAQKYLACGEYLWNTGIFAWKTSVILEKYKEFLPDIYQGICRASTCFFTEKEEEALAAIYPTLRNTSIDYGILERAENIVVIPAAFGWSDMGSWDALGAIYPKDEGGNVAVGKVVAAECKNSVFYSSFKTVAALGVENLIVAETADVVMICPKNRAQEVKKLVDCLKEKGREDLL